MSLRDKLKKREERRDQAANGGINAGLPEGVTRYVRLGQELKDGKDFVILRDPNLLFFYYVHEDGDYATRATYVKKHTCLHSPKRAPENLDEFEEIFTRYEKPNPSVCISDKAKAKRVLYFMIPVYDIALKTWRVLDLKEFHVNNLLDDIEKLTKAARKFDKGYEITNDVISIGKADKTYSIQAADVDDEDELAKILAEAKAVDISEIDYEVLANFRSEDDIIELLQQADPSKVDKSVLGGGVSEVKSEPVEEIGEEINEEDVF